MLFSELNNFRVLFKKISAKWREGNGGRGEEMREKKHGTRHVYAGEMKRENVLVVLAKDDYNLLGFSDADYGRQHWRCVQAMPRTAELRWRRTHARSRPRQRRYVPVVHTETDWILFLKKKICVIFPELSNFRAILKKN